MENYNEKFEKKISKTNLENQVNKYIRMYVWHVVIIFDLYRFINLSTDIQVKKNRRMQKLD